VVVVVVVVVVEKKVAIGATRLWSGVGEERGRSDGGEVPKWEL
jgi:hypothetical protein